MTSPPTANRALEALLSDPGESVIVFDLKGCVLLWNQTAEALYGYTQSEILGKSVSCLLPFDELPVHEELLKNLSCPKSRLDSLAERLNRSGVCVPVRIRRNPIPDAQGDTIGILERSQALSPGETCSVAEAHLRLLVEQIPVFFWTTDSRLRITSNWGRTVPALRGVSPTIPSARRSTGICAATKTKNCRSNSTFSHSAASLPALNTPAVIAFMI